MTWDVLWQLVFQLELWGISWERSAAWAECDNMLLWWWLVMVGLGTRYESPADRRQLCFHSLMWPARPKQLIQVPTKFYTWEQDPRQQNTFSFTWLRFIFLWNLSVNCFSPILKGYGSNHLLCLAGGSSSKNSSCITQSFPRGMSEMCVKYNLRLKTSWYLLTDFDNEVIKNVRAGRRQEALWVSI